ncbi:MAG: hypothetical protein AAF423_00470 [Pseudomonadota bacterium]
MPKDYEKIVYEPFDVQEFLQIIQPNLLGYERIVRSVRQATAGVENAKSLIIGFVSNWLNATGRNPY